MEQMLINNKSADASCQVKLVKQSILFRMLQDGMVSTGAEHDRTIFQFSCSLTKPRSSTKKKISKKIILLHASS